MDAVRNLTHHRPRSFVAMAAVAISVLALTLACAGDQSSNAPSPDGTYYGGRIEVGAVAGQAAALPLTKIDEIKQVSGVKAAFPTYRFDARTGQVTANDLGGADLIVASDPTEAAWSSLKTSYAQGHAIDADSSGEVVLGSKIAKELNKKIGETIDLPVKPVAAVSHSFKVVGILDVTRTAPDNFAYVNITDGQMLLKDSMAAAQVAAIDVTTVAGGIDVYAKAGISIADLDRIADQINEQVKDVKAIRPSQLVSGRAA